MPRIVIPTYQRSPAGRPNTPVTQVRIWSNSEQGDIPSLVPLIDAIGDTEWEDITQIEAARDTDETDTEVEFLTDNEEETNSTEAIIIKMEVINYIKELIPIYIKKNKEKMITLGAVLITTEEQFNREIANEPTCSICLVDQTSPTNEKGVLKTHCGHAFHEDCISMWTLYGVNDACPVCREMLTF